MYRHEDHEQLKVELAFGVTLREDNRWAKLGEQSWLRTSKPK